MKKSKIYCYKASEIKKEYNMLIEDLPTYLSANAQLIISKNAAAYQAIEQYVELPIVYGESKQLALEINYVVIENGDLEDNTWTEEKKAYFFVEDILIENSQTMRLFLTLDLINTLGLGTYSAGNPKNFTALTHITREHRDRFYLPNSYTPNTPLFRKIDPMPEGINPQVLKSSHASLYNDFDQLDWYLIFKTQNGLDPSDISNPIDILLYPSEAINVAGAGSSVTFDIDDLQTGRYYYFINDGLNTGGCFNIIYDHNIPLTLTLGQTIRLNNDNRFSWGHSCTLQYVLFYKSGSTFNVILTGNQGSNWYYKTYNSTASDGPLATEIQILAGDHINYGINEFKGVDKSIVLADATSTTSVGDVDFDAVNSIDDLDRTDSKIMKVIKLPYCPLPYGYIPAGVVDTDAIYVFDFNLVNVDQSELKITSYKLGLDNPDILDVEISELTISGLSGMTDYDAIDPTLESKQYASEFYIFKLSIDAFTAQIKLENLDLSSYLAYADNEALRHILIDFKTSNNMSGVYAFKWKSFNNNEIKYLNEQDYEQYIIVARNNEIALFNNDFVNYIRSGYNYDLKANQLANEQAALQIGINAAMLPLNIASIKQGAKDETGAQLAQDRAAAGVSGATSLLGSILNMGFQIENQKNQMAKQLSTLSQQATKVTGANDIDILTWLSNNKLNLIKYKPRQDILNMIIEYLRLYGYATNKYAKPSIDTRRHFNFLQCTPAYASEGLNECRRDWLKALTILYEQGVTIFHKYMVGDDPEWDLTRTYENWESKLF